MLGYIGAENNRMKGIFTDELENIIYLIGS